MSSSSDDEDDFVKKQLLEAASEELMQVMNKKKDLKTPSSKKKIVNTKPSLRKNESEESDKQFELNSTPEFKSFVAKKLSSYLDGIIEMQSGTDSSKLNGNEGLNLCGIKLLRSSQIYLKEAIDEDFKTNQKIRKRSSAPVSSDESSDEEQRLKYASVCLTGDSILDSGEGAFQRQVNMNGDVRSMPKDMDAKNDVNCKKVKHKSKKKKKLDTVS